MTIRNLNKIFFGPNCIAAMIPLLRRTLVQQQFYSALCSHPYNIVQASYAINQIADSHYHFQIKN
jgi:hypothetical protein